MEQTIASIIATITGFIEQTPPLYWGGGLALLAILLVIWLIARRKATGPKLESGTIVDESRKPELENGLMEGEREEALPPDAVSSDDDETKTDHAESAEIPELKAPVAETMEIPEQPSPEPVSRPTKSSLMARLKSGLAKTRSVLSSDIENLFKGRKALDEDLLEDLEELLITSDVGVETSMNLIERLEAKRTTISDAAELKAALKSEILSMLKPPGAFSGGNTAKPHVVMVVGVNGVGKTTTIGKLAARYSGEGKTVLIAAADTFRAAAIDQLQVWADRASADIVKHRENSDPAAVAFDGMEAALARGTDVVLIDTAGRLHTKVNLMEELKKIKRTVTKKIPDAPHEILLVLDATTGQNAVKQAQDFNKAMGVTAIALTKVDGTAKGGIVVSISRMMETNLKYIGVGEQIDDLQDFEPSTFVDAMLN